MTERSAPADADDSGDTETSGGRVVVVPDAGGTTDPAALWAIRTEARDSLETTIEAIEEKDDKALSTVRINLVFVGVSLTAVSTFPAAAQYANWAVLLGLGSLLASTGLGIVTYMGTDCPTGVGPGYLADARAAGYSESEWLHWMTARYEDWTAEAMTADQAEATVLQWAHLAQAVGILLLTVGLSSGVVDVAPLSTVASGIPFAPLSGRTVAFCDERSDV